MSNNRLGAHIQRQLSGNKKALHFLTDLYYCNNDEIADDAAENTDCNSCKIDLHITMK